MGANDVEVENVLAIAKYNFSGRNNDELSFSKNDVISVIQMLDGGWWEGTLNGQVGWFPSNFVGIVDTGSRTKDDQTIGRNGQNNDIEQKKTAYHDEVIVNCITKLKDHTETLRKVRDEFFVAIKAANVLNDDEFLTISMNTIDILEKKQLFLLNIEKEARLPLPQQRFGQLFLDFATYFCPLLKTYCENHCFAVELINSKRDALTECLSTKNLGLKDLITHLSAVFRHFEKYSVTLQEIERNIAETHPDRGNLQRACIVYNDLYNSCEFIRKQKSTQIEFLASGVLASSFGKNWSNELGDCIFIGNIGVSTSTLTPEHIDDSVIRCIAIFSKTILLFEVLIPTETDNSTYALKSRISYTDLCVAKDNFKCLLRFCKNSKIVLLAKALTNEDYHQLLVSLANCPGIQFDKEALIIESNNTSSTQNTEGMDEEDSSFLPQQETVIEGGVGILRRGTRGGSTRKKKPSPEVLTTTNGIQVNHELEMILPDGLNDSFGQSNMQQQSARTHKRGKQFSGWCLQPLAPPRGEYLPGSACTSAIKMRKGLSAEEQEDALVLKIVEGYCNSGHSIGSSHLNHCYMYQTYHNSPTAASNVVVTHNGAIANGQVKRAASYPEEVRPQLIVAENEKIFVEEVDGDEVIIKERSLVDTVYALKDQLTSLQKDVSTITKTLDKEQKARRRFEESMRRSSQHFPLSMTPKPTTSGSDEK